MCNSGSSFLCVSAQLLAGINQLPLKIGDIKTSGPVHLADLLDYALLFSQPEESIPLAYVA